MRCTRWYNVIMNERLQKYYSGHVPDEDCDRGSAIAAFSALLRNDTREGRLFLMVPDELMERYLREDDYRYWLDCKEASSV